MRGVKEGGIDLHCAGGEFNPNGGLGVCVKLSCAEPAQEVGLAHSGVSHDHELEEIVVPAQSQLGALQKFEAVKAHFGMQEGVSAEG